MVLAILLGCPPPDTGSPVDTGDTGDSADTGPVHTTDLTFSFGGADVTGAGFAVYPISSPFEIPPTFGDALVSTSITSDPLTVAVPDPGAEWLTPDQSGSSAFVVLAVFADTTPDGIHEEDVLYAEPFLGVGTTVPLFRSSGNDGLYEPGWNAPTLGTSGVVPAGPAEVIPVEVGLGLSTTVTVAGTSEWVGDSDRIVAGREYLPSLADVPLAAEWSFDVCCGALGPTAAEGHLSVARASVVAYTDVDGDGAWTGEATDLATPCQLSLHPIELAWVDAPTTIDAAWAMVDWRFAESWMKPGFNLGDWYDNGDGTWAWEEVGSDPVTLTAGCGTTE